MQAVPNRCAVPKAVYALSLIIAGAVLAFLLASVIYSYTGGYIFWRQYVPPFLPRSHGNTFGTTPQIYTIGPYYLRGYLGGFADHLTYTYVFLPRLLYGSLPAGPAVAVLGSGLLAYLLFRRATLEALELLDGSELPGGLSERARERRTIDPAAYRGRSLWRSLTFLTALLVALALLEGWMTLAPSTRLYGLRAPSADFRPFAEAAYAALFLYVPTVWTWHLARHAQVFAAAWINLTTRLPAVGVVERALASDRPDHVVERALAAAMQAQVVDDARVARLYAELAPHRSWAWRLRYRKRLREVARVRGLTQAKAAKMREIADVRMRVMREEIALAGDVHALERARRAAHDWRP